MMSFESNRKKESGLDRTTLTAGKRSVYLADNRQSGVLPSNKNTSGTTQLKKNKGGFRGLKLSLQEFHAMDEQEMERQLTMEKIRSGKKNIRIQDSKIDMGAGRKKSFKGETLNHLDELSRTETGHHFLKALLQTQKPITIKQSTTGRNTTSTTATGVKEDLAKHPLVADWMAKRGARILNNNVMNRARETVSERNGGIHVQNYKQAEADGRDEALAATDGRGTGSIVEIDHSALHYGDGSHAWQTERPKYGLYHELVHALHKGKGTEAMGNHKGIQNKEWQVLGEGPYADEEFSEKTIREDMDKDARPDYDGVTY